MISQDLSRVDPDFHVILQDPRTSLGMFKFLQESSQRLLNIPEKKSSTERFKFQLLYNTKELRTKCQQSMHTQLFVYAPFCVYQIVMYMYVHCN